MFRDILLDFDSRYLFQGLVHLPWKCRVTIALGDLLYLNILTVLFGNLYCSIVVLDFIAMCSHLYSGFSINLVGDDQACLGENVTADDLFALTSAWQPV